MSKHTPKPWRWEFNAKDKTVCLVGGRPRFDLLIMDFARCGMGGATMRLRDTAHDGLQIMHRLHERPDWIAPEEGREHHKSWHQLVTHPDARLIAAAPDLLEALKLFIQYNEEEAPLSFPIDEMWAQARAAIAKAEGEAV